MPVNPSSLTSFAENMSESMIVFMTVITREMIFVFVEETKSSKCFSCFLAFEPGLLLFIGTMTVFLHLEHSYLMDVLESKSILYSDDGIACCCRGNEG